jgi:enolase
MKNLISTIKQNLHSGWVIANHILVSFHVAFISSILCIREGIAGRDVLAFVFTSTETIVSAVFWFFSFHTGIAIHEMGHYLQAVRLNALKENLLPEAQKKIKADFFTKLLWYIKMYLLIPYGAFAGVKREGLTYYPDAPFNLAVAAAGPTSSGNMALVMLPVAAVLLVIGLIQNIEIMIYLGRLSLGIGLVGLLDFLLADPGKYREFRAREAKAKEKAETVVISKDAWMSKVKGVKQMMMSKRIQEIPLPDGDMLRAPWQYRNCGMGGRHTEKEYPESNISMQEMMFVPLCAKNYEEAQMITVALQTRLKEIMEKSEGARVMGIGLEGGLAPFVAKEPQDQVPEQRMWRMAVQAIRDIGYKPGDDIAIAFDPALSELSNAYREEFNQPDAVGMYYFWRGEEKVVMSRDQLVELFKKAVEEIPIVSLEDAFAEDDHEGWRLLMKDLGDKIFIIGDDLVTTKDSTIEECASKGLINTALIKANQIGTLSETLIAMLVALGKGLDLVVSHRSKSPNDDMEAQIALAVNSLGLKAGGGANTERLYKYGSVTKTMKEMERVAKGGFTKSDVTKITGLIQDLVITEVIAYEEPTNAGIPSVGVDLYAGIAGSEQYRKILKFTGSTPLGTSAGTGEAIHLIDSTIERSGVVDKYPELFTAQADKTFRFKKGTNEAAVSSKNDPELTALWKSVQRYEGKGCQNAVNNVLNIIAKEFIGKKVSDFTAITAVDRLLLNLEKETAIKRGKITQNASRDEIIEVMQRKGNLGMNAVLSMSLAMGRLIAHVQGKDLWQLLREEMKQALVKVIQANGGKTAGDKTTFADLIKGLQKADETLQKNDKKLSEALREQMPIYG